MEEQDFLEVSLGLVARLDINKIKELIDFLENDCAGKVIFVKKSAGKLKVVEENGNNGNHNNSKRY